VRLGLDEIFVEVDAVGHGLAECGTSGLAGPVFAQGFLEDAAGGPTFTEFLGAAVGFGFEPIVHFGRKRDTDLYEIWFLHGATSNTFYYQCKKIISPAERVFMGLSSVFLH
jgi:hypothetical protein